MGTVGTRDCAFLATLAAAITEWQRLCHHPLAGWTEFATLMQALIGPEIQRRLAQFHPGRVHVLTQE